MPPKRPAQTRTYPPIHRSYLGLGHCGFHIAEALFSPRAESIFPPSLSGQWRSTEDAGPASATHLFFCQRHTPGHSYIRLAQHHSNVVEFPQAHPEGYAYFHSLICRGPLDPKNKACWFFQTGAEPFELDMTRLFACPLKRGWARPTVLPNNPVRLPG